MIIRPVLENDRSALASLIHFERHIHRHLDWRTPLEWMNSAPFLVAEHDGTIAAALACPPDPPRVAWLRLFVVSTSLPVLTAWKELFHATLEHFDHMAVPPLLAAIPISHWFRNLLEASQFVKTDRVVVLLWSDTHLPDEKPVSDVCIRPMALEDLHNVEQVDHLAFELIWQNSAVALAAGFRQAAVATVAERQGKIIGYQISTAASIGGHLARLAVLPEDQGHGVGYLLVQDMLAQFVRLGIKSITVNTQVSNPFSLMLYQRAGFDRTGEEYPVYQYQKEG